MAKKKTRQELIDSLRERKKELQSARFRLSAETQTKTAARRTLRRDIARTLTALRDTGADDTSGV